MAKKLSCWLGRHVWTTRVEQGEAFQVCSECGRPPRDRTKGPENPPHDRHLQPGQYE